MAEIMKETRSFKFKTEDEKEFILSHNGKDTALNTFGKFIPLHEIEIAKKEVTKLLKSKK